MKSLWRVQFTAALLCFRCLETKQRCVERAIKTRKMIFKQAVPSLISEKKPAVTSFPDTTSPGLTTVQQFDFRTLGFFLS